MKKQIDCKIIGTSMLPVVNHGEIVTIDCILPIKLKIGDIVIFCTSKKQMIHRIIGTFSLKNTLFFWEKGDNCILSTIIPEKDIIARVVKINGSRQFPNTEILQYYSKRHFMFKVLSYFILSSLFIFYLLGEFINFIFQRNNKKEFSCQRTLYKILNYLIFFVFPTVITIFYTGYLYISYKLSSLISILKMALKI